MVEFKTDESAFNFALEYLKEISESLKMCKQMCTIGSIDGWINWLRIVYRELSAKTLTKEDEQFDSEFRKINVLINDPIKRKKERTRIFYMLDGLEIKLRKKLQQKGMLLPSKEDPMFSVLKK